MSIIKESVSAVGVLRDWLGAGMKPVPISLAEQRATICAACPENKHEKWWNAAKHAIAGVIRAEIEHKNHMKLRVSKEDDLNMCVVCGCALPLKVHVPIEHILANTDAETMGKFPDFCWIKKESHN